MKHNLVEFLDYLLTGDAQREKVSKKELFRPKCKHIRVKRPCEQVKVITQEINKFFMTKFEMFYEDGEPSKTKYFKEEAPSFPKDQEKYL